MRYIEDIQQIHIELTRDDSDILVVCSLLDKLCFLMVDWVRCCTSISRSNFIEGRRSCSRASKDILRRDLAVHILLRSSTNELTASLCSFQARQSLYFKDIQVSSFIYLSACVHSDCLSSQIDNQIKLLKAAWIEILIIDLIWKQCQQPKETCANCIVSVCCPTSFFRSLDRCRFFRRPTDNY